MAISKKFKAGTRIIWLSETIGNTIEYVIDWRTFNKVAHYKASEAIKNCKTAYGVDVLLISEVKNPNRADQVGWIHETADILKYTKAVKVLYGKK